MKKYLLFLLLGLLSIPYGKLLSQPVNSNYLIEHGVSPKILDAAASGFMQEGRFIQEVTITSKQGDEKKVYHIDVIYDPEYDEGMDVRIVNHSGELSKSDLKKLKKYIEKSHYFSRMSKNYIYDESSLNLLAQKGDTTILEFYYQKKDVDPYLNYVKKIKGFIYFVQDQLEKVVLVNTKPLKGGVTDYRKEVYYAKAEGRGGYIVSAIVEKIKIAKGNKVTLLEIRKKTLDYQDNKGVPVVWKGKEGDHSSLYTSHNTIKVKLGGALPLLGKEATKMGYQLPRPYGLAAFVYAHNQLMQFTGLQVAFDEGKMIDLQNLFELDNSAVTQSTFMPLVKADVWVFPFLNVMAIVGGGKNDLEGELVLNEDLRQFVNELVDKVNDLPDWIIDIPDLPNLPRSLPVSTTVRSEVYGGGATLAGGVGDFNLSVNYQLMFTRMVEANTTNMVNVITPLVGYMSPFGINFMLGAQGQFYNTALTGYFNITDNDGITHRLDYIVDFEPIQWNAIVGVYKSFYKHWEMSFQAGFGQRTSLTAVVGYRF